MKRFAAFGLGCLVTTIAVIHAFGNPKPVETKPAETKSAEPKPKSKIEEKIGEYLYPGAHITSGGTGKSGGSLGKLQSFTGRARALILTDDKVENVVKYYQALLRQDLISPPGGGYGRTVDGTSTLFQDDSERRPLTLKVFQRHNTQSSMTLVISRAENEKQTHIYWTLVERDMRP